MGADCAEWTDDCVKIEQQNAETTDTTLRPHPQSCCSSAVIRVEFDEHVLAKTEKGHRLAPPFDRYSLPLTITPAPSPPPAPRRSAKPLPRAIPLLSRGVDHPLLRVRIHHLRSHAIEP